MKPVFVAIGVLSVCGCAAPPVFRLAAPAEIELPKPLETEAYRECDVCPWMLPLPAGEMLVRSPNSTGVYDQLMEPVSLEAFDLATHETTVAQFAAFVEDTGYVTESERNTPVPGLRDRGCFAMFRGSQMRSQGAATWRDPLYEDYSPSHPVVCVSWNDAVAYASWLSEKTGSAYELPTQYEWEYAARAGTDAHVVWHEAPCRYENLRDQTWLNNYGPRQGLKCEDSFVFVAPVGSKEPTGWGLYDMYGNVTEWVSGCFEHENETSDLVCARRMKGGNWQTLPRYISAMARWAGHPSSRSALVGFRLKRAPDFDVVTR